VSAELSLVIPVLNERDAIPGLADEIERACEPLGLRWEAIFVDDGSEDGSAELLEGIATEREPFRLVRLRRNFGKSAALRAGFEQTTGDVVVTLDGDGQDDPAEIGALLRKLDEGYDVVSGWKRARRDPALKRWSSRLFNAVTRRMSGLRLHDFNCGLKAYRGECARSLDLYGELHRYLPLLAHQNGWHVTELPVNHRPRRYGRSRYGRSRYGRGLLDLLTVLFIGRYQYRPLHLFGGVGLALGGAGFVLLAYLTVLKLTGHPIGQRPLLTLGVLLVVVGIQLFSLGLVGELVTSLHEERTPDRERVEAHVDEIVH
jgi:glycosyltransferase involved in cell wall biosynthesis